MELGTFFHYAVIAIWLAGAAPAQASEQFGDILVTPQPFVSGETYHGYTEFRVLLENRSPKETRRVTLVYPDRSYGSGNSISRISRTVSVGPNSQSLVPFWLPPLPVNGTGQLRVEVDGEPPGTVNLPNRGTARSRYPGSAATPATILVSRSINYDDAARVLQGEREAFTARMATGAPDAGRSRGTIPTSWMPERSSRGPHWLELDYAPPQTADRVRIYETARLFSGEIILTGVSGTNLARVPVSGPAPASGAREFRFPTTPEPVKTVRLELGSAPPSSISIDAVELVGPSNSVWASSARASSDASSSFPASRSSGGTEPRAMLRAELPVGQWSDYWIAYTPYDGILLSAADLSYMPPAVSSALWRYAECGGQLVIFGFGTVPEPWRSLGANSIEGGHSFDVGFGQCFVFEGKLPADLEASTVKAVTGAINESGRYWQSLPDENGANGAMPLTENVRVPVRSTVLVMLAFVIVIGPLNLFVLSRMKRRVWMLWTIPVISLVTCVGVFAFSLVREGVTPTSRLQGVTLLDQASHRATTFGAAGFYCPLTPSQGLRFGYDTEVTPLLETWNYRSSGTRREMDWTQAQHLQRGWVTARVPAQFHLRKSEVRRERLELEKTGGELSVVNGLGAAINSLWLADESGRIYFTTNLAAGQKTKLAPSQDYPKVTAQHGPKAFLKTTGYAGQGTDAATNAAAFLLPGSYIAELGETPFLEKSLGGKTKSAPSPARSVVYGILERPHGL